MSKYQEVEAAMKQVSEARHQLTRAVSKAFPAGTKVVSKRGGMTNLVVERTNCDSVYVRNPQNAKGYWLNVCWIL